MSRPEPARRYYPLLELTSVRIKEFLREPEALFWVFAFPMLLAVALGFAFRAKGPDQIPVGVAEVSASDPSLARTLVALKSAPGLLARGFAPAEGREALRTGKISLLVETGPPVVFHFDETRPDSRLARLEAEDALQRAAGRRDAMAVRAEKVTARGSRYIDFLIPGLLGMNLMGTGVWSLAFGVTNARSRRILKRLVATPMHRGQYLLSLILGRLIFLLPEVVILVGVGWLFFGVEVRGSILLLLLTSILGAMTFCGIGLLVAARVKTIEGASGLANLVLMPMWILSGVFFSSERFPDAAQPIIKALPLTALNQALRGIMTEGRGLAGIAPQLAIIAAWGLVSFGVALKIFRWR
ncbi:MAG TPA: ABC transporter permease [Thermoanaerobaculia bacterium]|jgi:ABC-type multidrug transport system permease subunit|nr:ABC transporter permease [Thermoanaerobaculia bacterium]